MNRQKRKTLLNRIISIYVVLLMLAIVLPMDLFHLGIVQTTEAGHELVKQPFPTPGPGDYDRGMGTDSRNNFIAFAHSTPWLYKWYDAWTNNSFTNENFTSVSGYPDEYNKIAQKITINTDGQITNVALKLAKNDAPTGTYYLALRKTLDGADLGLASIPASSVTGIGVYNFTFDYPSPWIETSETTTYYLVFYPSSPQTPENNVYWGGSNTTGYTGGQAYNYSGSAWNEKLDWNCSFTLYNTTSYSPGCNYLPITPTYGVPLGFSFSADGKWFAVSSNSQGTRIYRIKGNNFYYVCQASPTLGGNNYACDLSSNGTYLAVGSDSSPYLRIFKRNESDNNNYTQITNPASMPSSGQECGVEFSSSDTYLAVGIRYSSYIYKRSNDTFTSIWSSGSFGPDCSWSEDERYVAFASETSPYFNVYKRNNDSFSALTTFDYPCAGRGRSVALSSDGRYLCVGHDSYPFFTVYQNQNDKFYKQNYLSDSYPYLPVASIYDCVYTADNRFLIIISWYSGLYKTQFIYELTQAKPILTISDTTNVEETSATLNGYVDDGGDNTTAHFEYGTTISYGYNSSNIITIGTVSYDILSVLTPGTPYHYRLVGNNSLGTNYSSDSIFITKPDAPTVTSAKEGFAINLSWAKGTGANNTYIEYKAGSVPSWNMGEGTFLYNGTGTYYLHQNLPKGAYTYTFWSYAQYNSSINKFGDPSIVYTARPDDPIWQSTAKFVYDTGQSDDLRRGYQYWASNMTKKGQTPDLGYGYVFGMVADDNYLYVQGGNDKIYKIRTSDMVKISESPSPNHGPFVMTFAIDDSFVYRAGDLFTVFQHYKNDLSRKAVTGNYGGTINTVVTDDTYVYAGGYTTQRVYKYLKSDMSKVAESTSYGGGIFALDVDDTYIYAGGVITNTVRQYWKSNLTFKAQTSSIGGPVITVKIDDTYIYAGGGGSFYIYKFWKSNFSVAGQTVSYGSNIFSIVIDSTYLYAGGDSPYKINKYWKSNMTLLAQSEAYPGTIYTLALDSPEFIGLQSPLDGATLMDQTSANLTITVNNFEAPVNVTFYNASNNAILTTYTGGGNGTYYYNLNNLTVGMNYQWYVVVNGTFVNMASETWDFTPSFSPATKNFRIETINDNNITIKWENPPSMAWIAFSVTSRLSEVRQILGTSQEWFVPNLIKDTNYNLQWQVGDNYSQMSDYKDFNFTTGGWASLPDLSNYNYKRLVTIDHTGVGGDLENYALNLTLTDGNFRHSGPNWYDPSYPGFTHLNYTSKNDIRFVNYYRTGYLDYNITNWNVSGNGGISTQVIPNSTYYTGSFSTVSQAHDNDWLTQATPASHGILYYNYTIPVGAKTSSKFRVYQGEWIWDVTLPAGAYSGSELRFKSECDYDTPYIATYVWNYSSSAWYLIQNDTARYFYESQIGWEYTASTTIYVMPEHFNDTTQTNTKGIDGDYDTKFWMYYGHLDAIDNKTALSYSGVYGGNFTLGSEETYVLNPPTITNVVEYNGTSTSMNITWTTNELADGRIRYATNQWLLNSTWAYGNVNKTETFLHQYGNASHIIKLYAYSPYYIQTIDVNCSNYTLSNNPTYYYVNSSTGNYPAELHLNATADTNYLNWTIRYTYNKTVEWSTYTPDFMIANLPTNTVYYYQILATGTGGNSTYNDDFTLGTPPATPHGNIYSYDEDRPNITATVWGNLTDMNGNPSVDCSIQYWNETSTNFSETTATTKNAIGTFSKTITVDYGHTYYYRMKMVGSTTGYSNAYINDYMSIQPFFAGSYIEDDDNNGENTEARDREYRPTYPNGTVDLTAYGYIQRGYWEGSLQEENWMWMETNISTMGILTLHLYTKEYGHVGDYTLTVDDSGMRYVKLTNLNSSWYTFYITGTGGQMVLNWTKPGLTHRLGESRVDESKYVSFSATKQSVNYTIAYMDTQDTNISAYRWAMDSGLDLYSAMVVEYWGGGKESGLTATNTGTEYDRGQLFRGGVWNGEPYDTGTLEPTHNNKPMGAYRYCFAFTDYYWNLSLLPSDNITNYYYHYWAMNQHYSTYLGYPQDRLFDYNYLFQWKYDLLSYTRDWNQISNTEISVEQRIDNTSAYTFNSSYEQSLLVGYKYNFSFDPDNDNIWNFGLYTDGRWTNQQVGKYQQAFVIFNLPDNATLQGMDSDSDGLTDYNELFVYYTNPKSNDTDEDEFSDGAEIENATDPNIFSDTPIGQPTVTTYDATNVEEKSVTLNGDLTNDGGEYCTVRFEYGINTSYGTNTTNQTRLISNLHADIGGGGTEGYTGGGNDDNALLKERWYAQTFNFSNSQSFNVTNVRLYSKRVGDPRMITVSIRNTTFDGYPTGSDIAWGETNASLWSTNLEWNQIDFTTFYDNLKSGTKYAIVFRCTAPGGATWANHVFVQCRYTGENGYYLNGTLYKSDNAGASWNYDFIGGYDANFEVTYTFLGFNPGTLYRCRAFANNTAGSSYGLDKAFLTKPYAPTGLIVTNTGMGQQTLTWTHGIGYNRTIIRGNIGSYPATLISGTAIYNGTGNSTIVNGLGNGEDWYYRAWEYTEWSYNPTLYQFSDDNSSNHSIAITLTPPSITTNYSDNIGTSTARLHGDLIDDGGESCTVRFEYGINTSYGTNTSNSTMSNGIFYKDISSLSKGTLYHFRAFANNSAYNSTGSDLVFLTKPDVPTSVVANGDTTTVNLTWAKGVGANNTFIERNATGQTSWAMGNGTLIYNGTGTSFTDTGLIALTTYYYQLWSYTEWTYNPTLYQYSSSNASANDKTGSIPPIVITNVSTGVTEINATLNGYLQNDSGEPCTVSFEYGPTTAYGTYASFMELPTYIYIAGATTQKVYQYWQSNLTKKAETADYGGTIFALAEDDTYIYAGGATTQKVFQYWKSNMTKKAETADYGSTIKGVAVDNTYVYFGGQSIGKVCQYWKSNMTLKANASYGALNSIDSLTQDTDYVYAGGNTGSVYQYWKSNMTKRGETPITNEKFAVAVDNSYIYTIASSADRLYQYHKSDFLYKANAVSYGGNIRGITEDSRYVYVCGLTGIGYARKVVQFLKQNLSYVASTNFLIDLYAIADDEIYTYSGGTGTLYQHWKSNMSLKTSTTSYGGTIYAISLYYPQVSYTQGNAFSKNITLSPSMPYHYRAVADNTNSTGYGNDYMFFTPPYAPTNLFVNNTGSGQQTLTWTHGAGYGRSVVRANLGSYVTSPDSGYAVYNDTDNSVIVIGLGEGEDWYYTVWEYASGDGRYSYSVGNASNHRLVGSAPQVQTNASTYFGNNVTLNGYLINDGNLDNNASFEWGKTTSYGVKTANQSKTTNQSFLANILGYPMYQIQQIIPSSYSSVSWTSPTLLYDNDWATYTYCNANAPYYVNYTKNESAGVPITAVYWRVKDSTGTYTYTIPVAGWTGTNVQIRILNYHTGSDNYVTYYYWDGSSWTTLDSAHSFIGTTAKVYEALLTWEYGFIQGGTYHYRAVAENQLGKVYGNDMTFLFSSNAIIVTDIATDITSTNATINGHLNSAWSENCTVWFEWGNTIDYKYADTKTHSSELIASPGDYFAMGFPVLNMGYWIRRPTGQASVNFIPVGDSPNWKCVDDEVADDYTTYVDCTSIQSYLKDRYAIDPLPGYVDGDYSVTVYSRSIGVAWQSFGIDTPRYPETVYTTPHLTGTWRTDSRTWGGLSKYDIVSMRLLLHNWNSFRCTQLYCNITGTTPVLTPGTLYHYRAVAPNSVTINYGDDMMFLTKPETPSFFYVSTNGSYAVDLAFTKGTGANGTYIEYKTGSGSSWTIGSGTVAYNGIGSTFKHSGLIPGTLYRYQAWSVANNSGLTQYSDAYQTGSTTTVTVPISAPTSFNAPTVSTDTINLTWIKGANSTKTYIRYRAGDVSPTSLTDGTFLYNGTGTATSASGLAPGQYGFSAWGWNETMSQYSPYYVSATNTTAILPVISNPSPSNGATAVEISLSQLSITITDADGQLVSWSIQTSPNKGSSSGSGYNGTKTCTVSGLAYSTTYTWYVNATDGYGWTRATYTFTTTSGGGGGGLGITTNDATSVEETTATLNGLLSDGGGETCNVWFGYGTTVDLGSVTPTQYKTSGQAFSADLTGLSPGIKYYFRAGASNSHTNSTYGSLKEFLTKPSGPPQSFTVTTYDNQRVDISWTKPAGAMNTLIVRKQDSYPTSMGDGTTVYTGTGTTYSDTGLTQLSYYYYRAWSYATGSTQYSDDYSQAYALTLPRPPTSITAHIEGVNDLRINWTSSPDTSQTIVIFNLTSYPQTINNGLLKYNGTATTFLDLNITSPIYYSLFAYTVFNGTTLYSRYAPVPFGGMFVNCYDEETHVPLIFDIFVTNQGGTDTYNATGESNTFMIPTNDLPFGSQIAVQVNSSGHYPRYYYMDIEQNGWYSLDAYLPNTATAKLYLITVVNQYDFPVENVKVITKATNLTGQYTPVSILYTDANGQVNLYLIPNKIYKWELSNPLYNTAYPDYIPSVDINTHTFRLTYPDVNQTTPEALFSNLVWSLEPSERYHTNGFTVTFRITSSTYQLESFRMVIWYLNQSTFSWESLFSQNVTNSPGGGVISFYVANETGQYRVLGYMKKYNFTEVELFEGGGIDFFISWGGLGTNPVFGNIPDWIYLLVIVIIMIVVMAYILPYAGIATGYIGIGIFGFALALKPDLTLTMGVGGADPVSGWLILVLTSVVYTIALFIWSRI